MWRSRPAPLNTPTRTTRYDATPAARTLVVTANATLLDDLLRLAAAASVEVEVAAHAQAAARSWQRAPQVVVGADLLDAVITTAPRRRSGVLVAHSTTPGADVEPSLWRRAVEVGAEHVVSLPQGETWLVARLAEGASGARTLAPLLVFMGGRGGAGTSTVAASVALRAARSMGPAALIDLDPWGGGLDLMLGIEESNGLRWPELSQTVGRVAPEALIEALPRVEQLSVLSWDRGAVVDLPPTAVSSVLDGALRGFELVVADLARTPCDAGAEALRRASALVVVVPREIRAVAATQRLLRAVSGHSAPVWLVTRGPGHSGLDAIEVASALELELIADLRHDPRIAAAVERAEPLVDRGPLAHVADAVLAMLQASERAA